MSKDTFSLKYRPKKIADLVGQEAVVRILSNTIKSGDIHHAYIFAGKWGSGKCITGDSIICTPNGLRRIGSIIPLSDDASKPELISRIDQAIIDETGIGVSEFGYSERQTNTIFIETEAGFSIEGTPEHPIRIIDSRGNIMWKKLGHLLSTDYVAICRNDILSEHIPKTINFEFNEQEYANSKHKNSHSNMLCMNSLCSFKVNLIPDKSFARFIGYVISEGHVSDDGFFISNTDFSVIDEVVEVLEKLGISPSVFEDNRRSIKQKVACASSAGFLSFLAYLGLKHKSAKKRIPDEVLAWPRSLLSEFLRAYFEGDGGIDGDSVSAYSTSRELLSDIQIILLSFGIVSRISYRQKTCTNCKRNQKFDSWQLKIYGLDTIEFANKIGFISKRKQEALSNKCANRCLPHWDIIPGWMERLIEMRKNLPILPNGSIFVNGVKKYAPRWQNRVFFGRQKATYSTLKNASVYFQEIINIIKDDFSHTSNVEKCNRYLCEIERVLTTKYLFLKIKHIAKNRKVDVFDLCKSKNDHSFIANGFINHNTSAARVFAASLNNPNGPSVEPDQNDPIVQSILEGRCVDVKELNAASNRGIDDIRALKDSVSYAPLQCRYKFVILDECLSKLSRIDTDIGKIPIGVIVSNKLTPKIRSYNHDTGKIEYKNITGWFKNSGKEIFKVTFEGKGAVYASSGHLFATKKGYVPLKNLKISDRVLRFGKPLDSVSKQVILGSLLGDMSIQRSYSQSKIWGEERGLLATRARLKMVHGEKQFDYINFKKNVLSRCFDWNKRDFLHAGFGGTPKPMRSYVSKTASSLSEIFALVIQNRRKKINISWLDQLGPVALATWYCDDGSVQISKTKAANVPYVSLHTQGFTKKENEMIARWLTEKGYNSKIYSDGKRNKKKLWHISMDKDGSENFLKTIAAYIHPSMRYKLGELNYSEFDEKLYLQDISSFGIVEEFITGIKNLGYYEATYDLEIEDNHNYFCSDTLVHNCQSLTDHAAEAALKLIEEPPPNVIFILATTEIQKIKNTILSRCMILKFNKIPFNVIYQQLKKISEAEGLVVDDHALKIATRSSQQSMRNALQSLQLLVAYAAGQPITRDIAERALASVDESYYFDLIDAILKPDAGNAMRVIDHLLGDGRDIGDVQEGLVGHLEKLLILKSCPTTSGLIDLSDLDKKRFEIQRNNIHLQLIIKMVELAGEIQVAASRNINPQVALEMFVVKAIIENATLKRFTREQHASSQTEKSSV